MRSRSFRLLSNMNFVFILSIICFLSFYQCIAQESATILSELQINSVLPEEKDLKTYIVHVSLPEGRFPADDTKGLDKYYKSFLPTTTSSDEGTRVIYLYRNVVTGFAARLSPEEVKEMAKMEGFISARQQRVLSLHTTHSPAFLGLHQNFGLWKGSNYGEGVIIGVLDSGISPGHPSFSDQDMPPPPAKWKGKCELNVTSCNNKLIGARNFISGVTGPPVDNNGHGTHTASTAAGNFVKGASVFGNAKGTAVGMAPRAHLAIYQVCSDDGCADSDILAAMDAAVDDGVDILSLSLGGPSLPFYMDGIAIGAFGAIQKGIFVSCSAGNSGPESFSLSNEAPWILTVGASTVDRNLRATAYLGNMELFDGESLFQPDDFQSTFIPLIYPGMGDENAAVCAPGSLDNIDVTGKVVLCNRGGGIGRIAKGQVVKDAGGAAMILTNAEPDGYSTIADPHVLPATHVSYAAGEIIKKYINSTSNANATIVFKGTVIGEKVNPVVTSFSSRGPSLESPGIVKPDIIGPGVSILAAWPTSVDNYTTEVAPFNMISGTSMSCPHLSGIAALLKCAHPDWSPAAIKSAIMTSADQTDLKGELILDERMLPADVFATGSGHVNPSKASDPGLVYDIHPDDYIPYLCGLGYSDRDIWVIMQKNVNCSEVKSIPEAELNYPSFAIALNSTSQAYTRTVTNVGEAGSTYYLAIAKVPGVEVIIKPSILKFTEVNQQTTYQITFTRQEFKLNETYVQGAIEWISQKHVVRSPISVQLV